MHEYVPKKKGGGEGLILDVHSLFWRLSIGKDLNASLADFELKTTVRQKKITLRKDSNCISLRTVITKECNPW